MARPVSIKDETIIAAARAVFLERGIQATTAEVAERAGVSEGSVFKRFKSKVDLFRAAMDDQLHEPDWVRELPGRVGKGDVRANLEAVGLEMIGFFRDLMPLLMMSWSNPAPNGLPCTIAGPNPPPVRALRSLAGYVEAEMRAGRIRAQEPEIVARAFLGIDQPLRLLRAVAQGPRHRAHGRRDLRARPREPPLGRPRAAAARRPARPRRAPLITLDPVEGRCNGRWLGRSLRPPHAALVRHPSSG
ncbi:MAG: helix-turn-helix domain-containing protein [Minicystis sp.]